MPEREILQLTICHEKDGDKLQELESIQGGVAFVSLINTKVILDTLALSLKLPTQPFYPGQESITASSFIEAINATLTYLEEKPTFFTYRMGQEMGEQIWCFGKTKTVSYRKQRPGAGSHFGWLC